VTVWDGAQNKLSPKFYGPYEIIEKIGALAYRLQLQLPARARIHNMFHAAFLKKAVGALQLEIPPLPPIVRVGQCHNRRRPSEHALPLILGKF
jgi:hypothetical protein